MISSRRGDWDINCIDEHRGNTDTAMLSPLLENEDDTASIRRGLLADQLSLDSSSIDDCDYDKGLVSLDEEKMSASQGICSMDILRISCVIIMTLGGVSAYLTASIKVLTANAMSMSSSELMVVIAGITCLASSSVVWRGEVQTRLYPPVETLRLVNRGLRAYSIRLREELQTLKCEHELLITEVDRYVCDILRYFSSGKIYLLVF